MYLTNIKRLLTRSQKKTKYLYHETRQRTLDVVVMDRSKYIEKCLHILQTEQFTKLRNDPTKSIEKKIRRELRKMKIRLTTQEHHQLYPSLQSRKVLWHCKAIQVPYSWYYRRPSY